MEWTPKNERYSIQACMVAWVLIHACCLRRPLAGADAIIVRCFTNELM